MEDIEYNWEIFLSKLLDYTYIVVVEGDIVDQKFCDSRHAAIVNAANSQLAGGTGIDKAVHDAAGLSNLLIANAQTLQSLNKKQLDAGEAVITEGFDLIDERPKKQNQIHYIIHAVAPIIKSIPQFGSIPPEEQNKLSMAYTNSLKIADSVSNKLTANFAEILEQTKREKWEGLREIAFPALGTGVYGYPIDQAIQVAINAVLDYLAKNYKTTLLREIRFVTHGKRENKFYPDFTLYTNYLKIDDTDDDPSKYLTQQQPILIPQYLKNSYGGDEENMQVTLYKVDLEKLSKKWQLKRRLQEQNIHTIEIQ